MATLAKQSISDTANKWIIEEAERLNRSKAYVVRQLLDAASSEDQSNRANIQRQMMGGQGCQEQSRNQFGSLGQAHEAAMISFCANR